MKVSVVKKYQKSVGNQGWPFLSTYMDFDCDVVNDPCGPFY